MQDSGRARWLAIGAAILTIATLVAPPTNAVGIPDPAAVGQWTAPAEWPIKATHAVLLATGKVLAWEETGGFLGFPEGETRVFLWDPSTKELEPKSLDAIENIFCAGHAVLPDGRVLIVGGAPFYGGPPSSFLFDPWAESWSRGPTMAEGRYYPTALSLADGRVLAAGGMEGFFDPSDSIESILPGPGETWRVVDGADLALGEYPWMTLGPDGRVVRSGPVDETLFLEPDGGGWVEGPMPVQERREGGSVALLPGGGRILAAGGQDGWGRFPSATAEILELDDDPSWVPVASMAHARKNHHLTLLADGTVLAMGGDQGLTGTVAEVPGVFTPEIYDPDANVWSSMAPNQRTRAYHSSSLLLPDGRVLSAGGEMEGFPNIFGGETMELFSPPYLFRGPRPVLEGAPAQIEFGHPFVLHVDPEVPVSRLALSRAGSVTHSLNFDQRYVELSFEAPNPGTLVVRPPAGPLDAPPGTYMLFGLSESGVPWVAPIVRVST